MWTICDSMDHPLPGSSVHGILQARILEWIALPFSRWSSHPRNRTQVSCIAGRLFTIWEADHFSLLETHSLLITEDIAIILFSLYLTGFSFSTSFDISYTFLWAFLVVQTAKNLPAMQEIWVQSLARKDSLEKEMVIHSSILAWRIPWTEEPGQLQSMGSQRVRHDGAIFTYIHTFFWHLNTGACWY